MTREALASAEHRPEYYTQQLQGGDKARRWCVRCSCGWEMRTLEPGPAGKRLVRGYFEDHAREARDPEAES